MRGTLAILIFLGLALVSAGWALMQRESETPLPALTVELLNGCGEAGLAARVAGGLRRLGQDVVAVEDADHHHHERTVLVDRRGRPQVTRRLARALGDPLVVLERRDPAPADVTLILGADHARLRLGDQTP